MTTLPLWGRRVVATGDRRGPARRGARALAELGARVAEGPGPERLRFQGRELTIASWPAGAGPLAAEYGGLVAAAELLADAESLDAADVLAGLEAGMIGSAAPPHLVRARDGWLVVRWRTPHDAELLSARLGAPVGRRSVAEGFAAARECRLLVAPVRTDPRLPVRPPALTRRSRGWLAPSATSAVAPLRVIDWSVLWAGPWATGQLAAAGARVTRVEPPSRRDGLLRTAEGREIWQRFNGSKLLLLANARTPAGHREIAKAVAACDVLVASYTPRVLPQLGFADGWFDAHAPRALRVDLVAYEPPFAEAPGLGEQAAAMTGLINPAEDRPPRPWADPLLGAWVLVVVRAWIAGGRPPGLSVRLSLEAAAARVLGRRDPMRGLLHEDRAVLAV